MLKDGNLMNQNSGILKSGCLAVILCMAAVLAGCATAPRESSLKANPYLPDESGRQVWTWSSQTGAPAAGGLSSAASAGNSFVRSLRRGDRVKISLTGIPQPEEIDNVVNDFGFVTLPLVGAVKIEGLTTARAEQMIKDAYIKGEYYKSIDVIVVAQAGEFYVRGEVKNEGVFSLSGDTTLVQGIIMAGGYTDYAKKWEITIIRGPEKSVYDAEKIEKREMEDPLIHSGDIIVVPRRVF